MDTEKTYSLIEINSLIKQTIEDKFFDYYSIVAEITSLNINKSGHCYLELVQKDEFNEKIIAKTRATIWASSFVMINSYFESVTGEQLKSGIKLLLKASVVFHELYGFSLNIVDIDPNYTLGDIERQKKEILDKLENEGVIDMNKDLDLAIAPKTIAIISSETAAGYEDFLNQLNNNQQNFVYHTKLFTAFMQGDKLEESIISALDKIYNYHEYFDLVVIIRGGGSKIELGAFDNYNIAYYITQFPLPVITGIGHDRDISICDIVAHTSVKTPTAVAEFIIEKSEEFYYYINNLSEEFKQEVNYIIDKQKNVLQELNSNFFNSSLKITDNANFKINLLANEFKNAVNQNIQTQNSELKSYKIQTEYAVKSFINNNINHLTRKQNNLQEVTNYFLSTSKHKLEVTELIIQENNPDNILSKGYTYITKKGKFVKDISKLEQGDIIVNHSVNKKIESEVIKK